jgi:hypothetical protein
MMTATCPSPQTAGIAEPRAVLDSRKQARILALLAMGCSRRMAARQVGCDPGTIAHATECDEKFHAQLCDAEAQADMRALQLINHVAEQEN